MNPPANHSVNVWPTESFVFEADVQPKEMKEAKELDSAAQSQPFILKREQLKPQMDTDEHRYQPILYSEGFTLRGKNSLSLSSVSIWVHLWFLLLELPDLSSSAN